MSYIVFALKWRPQNFDQVVGQSHVVTTLKNALEQGRLAHAYLFTGPRGVGKTSTARILAKSLNCKEGPTVRPCQKCSACREISEGRAFDVIEIDGASNRGIDEIRTLRENVKFAPTSGKYKVYIIDEVHMLTQEAFNALLKTLEEPPEYVKFIFATTHPHKLPPTILSRCHRLDFRRIPAMEVIAQLEKIVKAEKLKVSQEVLVAIARSCDGSLRDAESILDQLVSFSSGEVSLTDVVSVLGLVEQEALFELTDKLIARDARGALEIFNRVIDEGKDIAVFLNEMITHFRNLLVARISGADEQLIDLPAEICRRLVAQSRGYTMQELFAAFTILVDTKEMAKRLESLRIPFEVTLLRLSQPRAQKKPPEEKREEGSSSLPDEPRSKKQAGASFSPPKESGQSKSPPPPQSSMPKSISLEHVQEIWGSIVRSLERIKISIAHYLNEGRPVSVKGAVLTVAFPKNLSLHKEALEDKDNRVLIEKSIEEIAQASMRVNFVLTQEERPSSDADDHPFVKSALNTFGGRILKEE
ncbi:MAG: DNA polymerase III subunit gamma/tau [Candidatus Omnitrophica bacterium]|nr:DNA polymerase III subunit gamma/tau [Candidatus Omnitrophota bacterium]